MQTIEDRPATESPWAFCFRSPSELRKALEEYTSFDMSEGLPGSNGGDEEKRDRIGRIYAQNRAIDRGMVYVGAVSPYAWRLLDGYYRRGNWFKFRMGWITVLKALDMPAPPCPGLVRCRLPGDDRCELPSCSVGRECHLSYAVFQEHLDLSVEALLAAITYAEGGHLTP